MNGKIDIYCEFAFLEKFYSSLPKSDDRSNLKFLRYWQDFNELLCKHSSIVLMDINYESFVEQSKNAENSILREALDLILTASYNGYIDIACCPTEKKNMEAHIEDNEGDRYFGKEPQRIYLLDVASEKCQQLENDYGLMFISNDNFTRWANFLFTSDIALVNEKTKNWDFVKQYEHPCNSIILVNNYILDSDNSVLEKDINSLFDALLPMQLNLNTFNIQVHTTFTKKGNDNTKKELVESTIKKLRKYPINVKIFLAHKTTNNQHDRFLLTNYCMFNSGYGFVLGKEREKGTSLMVWPLTYISKYGNRESRNNVYQIMQYLREKN